MQKTAYVMGICDWSSDVCSSDLRLLGRRAVDHGGREPRRRRRGARIDRPQHRAAARAGAESLCHPVAELSVPLFRPAQDALSADRKSVVQGKSVSVRVDLGGRRIIKQKTHINNEHTMTIN